MSMHNFPSATAVAIEVSSLRGLPDNAPWMASVEAAAVARYGRPHWGQSINGDDVRGQRRRMAIRVGFGCGRRGDPAPVLVQSLVVESIANARLVRFVSTSSGTVLPDYTLLIEMHDFQAELGPGGGSPMRVVVRMDASMVRDLDREVVATRRIESIATPTGEDATGIVAAFDTAMQGALQDLLAWTGSVTSGRGGS